MRAGSRSLQYSCVLESHRDPHRILLGALGEYGGGPFVLPNTSSGVPAHVEHMFALVLFLRFRGRATEPGGAKSGC
nr:MAG TPA: hypothetical protein [Caudoviricetes sp.]